MKVIMVWRWCMVVLRCIFISSIVVDSTNEEQESAPTPKSTKKPNVFLILADDAGTGEVPGYWNTGLVEMPHLQQLVYDGVVFTDAHSSPLCSPSRYMLLSGNYHHRGFQYTGTWTLNFHSSQFKDGQKSIADVLKSNGYHTGMFGKYHIGGKVPTQSWYDPGDRIYVDIKDNILSKDIYNWEEPLHDGPQDIGFETSFVTATGIQTPPYSFIRDGMMQDLSNITKWEEGSYDMPNGESHILVEGDGSQSWDTTAYNMIVVNETKQFLNDHIENRNDDPFFAYVALGNVHIPHSPPTTYLDGTPVAGEYPTTHMDMLSEMDKVVGSLIGMLKERNLEDDTIIIFASDNGGLGPRSQTSSSFGHNPHGPFRGYKGSTFEGGHRIPLIMKWKNGVVPSGETRSRLIGLNDIYATLCDLVDVEVPDGQAIDSISFADYIEEEEKQDDLREVFGIWTTHKGTSTVLNEAIRMGNMKLIRNRQNGEVSLYDLDNDISESKSLISDSSYKEIIDEMVFKLEEISPCYDRVGSFSVKRLDGSIFETSCAWFEKMKSRCELFTEGLVECRLSCATGRLRKSCRFSVVTPSTRPPSMISSSPTKNPTYPSSVISPTISPSIITGSPIENPITFPSVSIKPSSRMVYSNAPSSANSFIECKDSSTFAFGNHPNGRPRTCEWLTSGILPNVSENRVSKWCERRHEGMMVKDYCRLSCKSCKSPSSIPVTSAVPTVSSLAIECKDSNTFTFGNHQSGKVRNCDWLTIENSPAGTKDRILKWCRKRFDGEVVKDHCRSSCKICALQSTSPVASSPPMNYVTVSPTKMPTAYPNANDEPSPTLTECKDSSTFTFGNHPNGRPRTCEWLTSAVLPEVNENRQSKWCARNYGGNMVKDYCQLSCESCKSFEN